MEIQLEIYQQQRKQLYSGRAVSQKVYIISWLTYLHEKFAIIMYNIVLLRRHALVNIMLCLLQNYGYTLQLNGFRVVRAKSIVLLS